MWATRKKDQNNEIPFLERETTQCERPILTALLSSSTWQASKLHISAKGHRIQHESMREKDKHKKLIRKRPTRSDQDIDAARNVPPFKFPSISEHKSDKGVVISCIKELWIAGAWGERHEKKSKKYLIMRCPKIVFSPACPKQWYLILMEADTI